MIKKIITVQIFIFWILNSVAYSQTAKSTIDVFLNYKNDAIKLKQSFFEDNQLSEYQFELTSNSSVMASGDNMFYQLENKKSKKTKSKDVIEFFSYIDNELNKLNYVNVFKNVQNRILTYCKKNSYRTSYLEVYYEDDKLSLIELTLMKEFGLNELKNIDSIYKIKSKEIDYLENELNKSELEILVTESKKLILTSDTTNISTKDSLVKTYNIEFNTGKLTFKNSSIPLISSLAYTIKNNTNRKFIIAGNTSSPGAENANYVLSKKRAEFICKILITYFDIDQEQIRFKGNGENHPINDNNTEHNRILNRRIDLIHYSTK